MEGAELHSAAISMRSSFPVPDGASAARRTETDHAATSAQRDDEQQRQDDHPDVGLHFEWEMVVDPLQDS